MVISEVIVNAEVKRILVDQGNSANILFRGVFNKLGLTNSYLWLHFEELIGFVGEKIKPDGYEQLHMTLGARLTSKMVKVEFLVVNCNSAYNAILGYPHSQ